MARARAHEDESPPPTRPREPPPAPERLSFLAHYPRLVAVFCVLQLAGWTANLLEICGVLGPLGSAVNAAALTFDVALCQLLYFGTLHYGLLDFSALNVVCRIAFAVDGLGLLLNYVLVEKPRSAAEAVQEKVKRETNTIAGVDAAIWGVVCAVSAWIGVQVLVVARMRLCEKWILLAAMKNSNGTGTETTTSDLFPPPVENDNYSAGANFQLAALSDEFAKLYAVAGIFILSVAVFAAIKAGTAEKQDEVEARVQNDALFSTSFAAGMLGGMKVCLFDASNAGTRMGDLLGCASRRGRAPLPLPVKIAAACFVVFVAIHIAYVVLAFGDFGSDEDAENDPAASRDELSSEMRVVEWACRLKIHLVPALVIWFCAAYGFGAKPSHMWDTAGTERRGGSGGGPKTLRIRLRAESDRVSCVDVRVRSAHGAAVWYYEVPPPAEAYFERVCLPEDETTPGEVRGANFGGAAPRSRRRTALEVQFPWEAVAGGAAVVEADEVASSSTSARKVVYDQVKAVRISAISYDSSGRVLGEDRIFATVGGTAGAASSSSFSLMSDSEQEAGALSTEDERHIRDYLIEEENERRTADEKMRHMAEKFQGLALAASSGDVDRGRLTATALEASDAAAIFDGGHLLEQILQQQNDHASPASKAVPSSSGSSGAASSPSSSDEQESLRPVDVLRLVLPRTASLATAFDFLLNRTGVAIGLPQELEYSKPNGMNEHGVVLREILPDRDFESVVGNFLMRSSVLPAAKQLYPEYGTFYVDRVHAFVLFYGGKYDRELKMHMDGAEVTFNVCLEKSSDATYEDELMFGRKNGAGGGAGRRLLKARQTQRGMKREVVTLPRELAGGRKNVDEEDDEAVNVLEVALQNKNAGERGKTESFLQELEPVEGGGGGKNRERGAARTTSKSHRPEARFFSEPNVGYLFLGQQNHGVANRNEGKAEAGRDGKRISLEPAKAFGNKAAPRRGSQGNRQFVNALRSGPQDSWDSSSEMEVKRAAKSPTSSTRRLLVFLLAAVVVTLVFLCPFTKTEESFNMQAVYDLYYKKEQVQSYDHIQFQGVVPRTFLGPKFIEVFLFRPLELAERWTKVARAAAGAVLVVGAPPPVDHGGGFSWAWFGEAIANAATAAAEAAAEEEDSTPLDGYSLLLLVRVFVGLCGVLVFSHLAESVGRAGSVFLLFLMTQFHLVFYCSRTLPNTFALLICGHALSHWLRGNVFLATLHVTACAIAFRCEMAVVFLALGVESATRSALRRFLFAALCGFLVFLPLTVVVDSFYWRQSEYSLDLCVGSGQGKEPTKSPSAPPFSPVEGLLRRLMAADVTGLCDAFNEQTLLGRVLRRFTWPELGVFIFNGVEHKSSDWGVMPWHWYFSNALPKAVGPLLLALVPEAALPLFGSAAEGSSVHGDAVIVLVSIIVSERRAFFAARGWNMTRFLYDCLLLLIVAAQGALLAGRAVASVYNYPAGWTLMTLQAQRTMQYGDLFVVDDQSASKLVTNTTKVDGVETPTTLAEARELLAAEKDAQEQQQMSNIAETEDYAAPFFSLDLFAAAEKLSNLRPFVPGEEFFLWAFDLFADATVRIVRSLSLVSGAHRKKKTGGGTVANDADEDGLRDVFRTLREKHPVVRYVFRNGDKWIPQAKNVTVDSRTLTDLLLKGSSEKTRDSTATKPHLATYWRLTRLAEWLFGIDNEQPVTLADLQALSSKGAPARREEKNAVRVQGHRVTVPFERFFETPQLLRAIGTHYSKKFAGADEASGPLSSGERLKHLLKVVRKESPAAADASLIGAWRKDVSTPPPRALEKLRSMASNDTQQLGVVLTPNRIPLHLFLDRLAVNEGVTQFVTRAFAVVTKEVIPDIESSDGYGTTSTGTPPPDILVAECCDGLDVESLNQDAVEESDELDEEDAGTGRNTEDAAAVEKVESSSATSAASVGGYVLVGLSYGFSRMNYRRLEMELAPRLGVWVRRS
eukprot:g3413.t1